MWDRNTDRMMEMWLDLLDHIERPMRYTRVSPRRSDVSVTDENGTVCITAELAGINKDEVDINVSSRTINVEAQSERKNFNWKKTFDYEIDPESVKATMVNGILDITIEKKEKTSAVKVEIE